MAMKQDDLHELCRLQTRRAFLERLGLSFTGLALTAMAARDAAAEQPWQPPSGLPMHPQRAKRVIWLFMRGGMSHMESFDPKPALNTHAGKAIGDTPYQDALLPEKLKNVRVVAIGAGAPRGKLFPLQVGSKRYGQCGVEISDWFPHIGACADEIAFIRSMWTTDDNHGVRQHGAKVFRHP
jgi:hypothetical protein